MRWSVDVLSFPAPSHLRVLGTFMHLPVICVPFFQKSVKLICQLIALNFGVLIF